MEVSRALALATGGRKTVAPDWVPATALRAVISDDPCLAWLASHGRSLGFKKDAEEGSFLSWIGGMGRQFEAKWIAEMAPEAIQANEQDTDVRDSAAVLRTLELMGRRVPVVSKAAIWLAELGVYGTCDLIALASWLREKFPALSQFLPEGQSNQGDHYVVIDLKYQTGLDSSAKRRDLLLASSQVRIYSHILGALQGRFPTHAFLVTRDRIGDPLPVPVTREPDGSLNSFLAEMLTEHKFINKFGRWMRPWKDGIVAPDWRNKKDAPWSDAKARILHEFMPFTPLHVLPHVGRKQAAALHNAGIRSVEDLLPVCDSITGLEMVKTLPGMGDATAQRLLAVLQAHRTGRPTGVPREAVPPLRKIEMFVDYEFLPGVHADFNRQWPALEGREMIFAIGCGWEENGRWQYTRFVAEQENVEAERVMWKQFLTFLRKRGVRLNRSLPGSDAASDAASEAALYCWSGAERSQSGRAAERLGIKEVGHLPWVDLQKVFLDIPIAIPGNWNFGLKGIVKALGKLSPEHAVDYPADLCSGMDAMVLAWQAYERPEPVETPEMKLVLDYLETDCMSLWQILRWLRQGSLNRE